jgi:hypothetical protein
MPTPGGEQNEVDRIGRSQWSCETMPTDFSFGADDISGFLAENQSSKVWFKESTRENIDFYQLSLHIPSYQVREK